MGSGQACSECRVLTISPKNGGFNAVFKSKTHTGIRLL
jgi:hypothetical protein